MDGIPHTSPPNSQSRDWAALLYIMQPFWLLAPFLSFVLLAAAPGSPLPLPQLLTWLRVTSTGDSPRCPCLRLCSPFYLHWTFPSTMPRSSLILPFPAFHPARTCKALASIISPAKIKQVYMISVFHNLEFWYSSVMLNTVNVSESKIHRRQDSGLVRKFLCWVLEVEWANLNVGSNISG